MGRYDIAGVVRPSEWMGFMYEGLGAFFAKGGYDYGKSGVDVRVCESYGEVVRVGFRMGLRVFRYDYGKF